MPDEPAKSANLYESRSKLFEWRSTSPPVSTVKPLGALLLACVLLTVFKAATLLILALLLTLIVWGAIFRPAATYGFFLFCIAYRLFESYPLSCLAIFAALTVAGVIGRAIADTELRPDRRDEVIAPLNAVQLPPPPPPLPGNSAPDC
ncbi:hypothetical protein KX816_01845 [Sphingosinicellaceae bacterium]|nr:hypothetical protein KX816_01845 [Sphingosinicellaceae bacterium]